MLVTALLVVLSVAAVSVRGQVAGDNVLGPCEPQFFEEDVIVLEKNLVSPAALLTVDVNGDEVDDLIVCQTNVCELDLSNKENFEERETVKLGLEKTVVQDENGLDVFANFVATFVRVGDIDQDGDVDIIVGGQGGVQVLVSDGEDFDAQFVTDPADNLQIGSLEVADMNNDDFPDLVLTILEEDRVVVLLNVGADVVNKQQQFDQEIVLAAPVLNGQGNVVENSTLQNAGELFVFDMDGDGDLDVVSGGESVGAWFQNQDADEDEGIELGTQFEQIAIIPNTNQVQLSNILVTRVFEARGPAAPADVLYLFGNGLNGEGDGSLKVYQSKDFTNAGFEATFFLAQAVPELSFAEFGDLSNDGLDDVVFVSKVEDEPVFFLLNEGDAENAKDNPAFGDLQFIANNDSIVNDIVISDIDGDGDKDIIISRTLIVRVEVEPEEEEVEEEEEEVENEEEVEENEENEEEVEEVDPTTAPEVTTMPPEPVFEESFVEQVVILINDCEEIIDDDENNNEDDPVIIGLIAIMIVLCACIVAVLICFIGIIMRGGTLPFYGPVGSGGSSGGHRSGSRRKVGRKNSRKL